MPQVDRRRVIHLLDAGLGHASQPPKAESTLTALANTVFLWRGVVLALRRL